MPRIINEPSRSLRQYRILTRKTTPGNVMGKVSLKTRLCCLPGRKTHLWMNLPLISAAMQAVSGRELAVALAQLGGISVIPCSIPVDEQAEAIGAVKRFKAGFQKEVMAVSPSDRISRLVKITKEKGYGKFPVTEDGRPGSRLVGIITRKNFDPREHLSDKVEKHMVKKVVTAKEGITLDDANRKMISHGIDVLPIVDSRQRVRYVVFKKDMEKHMDFPDSLVDSDKRYLVAAAVSTQARDFARADELLKANADALFIDSSDGFSEFQADMLRHIRKRSKNMPIIGGNIITAEAFLFLAEAGFDAVKVGMGIGSGCTTQAQKGTGRGQATAILDVCQARDEFFARTGRYLPVISDGSIANSGQIAVALALGADSVMMGRFFAQFTESAGGLRQHPSMGPLKEYWMEASARARNYGRYDSSSENFFEEGIEGFVPHIGSIYTHLNETVLKLRSSFSSAGCNDIDELHKNAVLELQSIAALQDADVHDIIAK